MAGAAAAMKTLQARRDMDLIKPVGHGGPVASPIVLTVPQAAIQDDHAGPYLLVVGNDGKVEEPRVRLGAMDGGNVLVHNGLNAGERVIVEGLQKVRPGMVVAVSGSAAMPAGPTGTCAKPGIGCSDEPLAMRERAR
jgi:hypothetical protein